MVSSYRPIETDGRPEDASDALADEFADLVEVELLGKGRADLVDDCQLSGALVGLGEEPFRLAEQPRVLEGDAHARGEGRQEPLVGLAVGVRLDALEPDDADDLLACFDRHAEP